MAKLYALAHPSITFTLIEGGRTVFRSPACEGPADRVREIFGKGLADSLAPIHAEESDLLMDGLLGKPGQSRSTRKEMIFFVNRRPVESKTISYAVLEAFHTFVPKGRFPPAILFLEIDPVAVDVNVHPSKREIRFRNEPQVRSFILGSVLSHNRSATSSVHEFAQTEAKIEYEEEDGRQVPKMDPQALEIFGRKQAGARVREESRPGQYPNKDHTKHEKHPPDKTDPISEPSPPPKPIIERKLVGGRRDPGAEWKFLDRAHGDLALFTTPQGMVALHTRAAYERVRFEQLEDGLRNSNRSASQALLLQNLWNLMELIDQIWTPVCPDCSLGFILEEFGRNFYRLEGCPHWIDREHAITYLRDFLEIAREKGGAIQVESFIRQSTGKTDQLQP